jgi:hypothetical protein
MLNRQLADQINASPAEDMVKASQYQIMNEIFIQTAKAWCKCPTCIARADDLIALIKKHIDSMGESEKNVETQAEA